MLAPYNILRKLPIEHTFVPKSVRAIAMLFLAISKLGEIVKHLYTITKWKKIRTMTYQILHAYTTKQDCLSSKASLFLPTIFLLNVREKAMLFELKKKVSKTCT
jgi:hypothetical protein